MISAIRRYINLWRFKRTIGSLPITKVDASTIEHWLMIIKPETYKEIDYRKIAKISIKSKHSCESLLNGAIDAASKIADNETHKRLHPLASNRTSLDAWFTVNGQTVDVYEYLVSLNSAMRVILSGLAKYNTHADTYYHKANAVDLFQAYHQLALALRQL